MKPSLIYRYGIVVGLLVFGCGSIAMAQNATPPDTMPKTPNSTGIFSVRDYGAVGDGKAIDSPAINRAIDAAAAAGGGTVAFPAGTYLTYSIHLKSNIALNLEFGATILAADPTPEAGYDPAEPNQWQQYQDGGHSHWHDSLIWGENLHDVSIVGPGLINGHGLSRGDAGPGAGGGGPRAARGGGPRGRGGAAGPAADAAGGAAAGGGAGGPPEAGGGRAPRGNRGPGGQPGNARAIQADKAIALKLCHNVTFRDFSILEGGHFGILATGVDNFTIDNLKIDTNRDGMDIDCCFNVRMSDCSVNSPIDDGICLKSSYGLGIARATENVTITNCQVSGYDVGTFLDGTFKRTPDNGMSARSAGGGFGPPNAAVATQPAGAVAATPPGGRGGRGGGARGTVPTGRIKMGTESNGGFKNVTISNCVFDYCRGLALETVDGGLLEDVTIDNITMRDVTNAPIYLRIGSRLRGPDNPQPGHIRRVTISNVVAYNCDPQSGVIISGIPGHPIEDVRLDNIRLYYKGGGTKDDADLNPAEDETGYPEPSNLGTMPSYGFFIRHVNEIEMSNIQVSYDKADMRPPFCLVDVNGSQFRSIKAAHAAGSPTFSFFGITDFNLGQSQGIPDTHLDKEDTGKL